MAELAVGLFLLLLGFSYLFDGLPRVLIALAAIVAAICSLLASHWRARL